MIASTGPLIQLASQFGVKLDEINNLDFNNYYYDHNHLKLLITSKFVGLEIPSCNPSLEADWLRLLLPSENVRTVVAFKADE